MLSNLLSKVYASLKHRQVQLLVLVSLYLIFSSILPLFFSQALYTASLLIKDILMWVLPFTIGLFIAHSISVFRTKAPLFVLTLICFETLSNLSSVWYSFLCGHLAVNSLPHLHVSSISQDFPALWKLPLPRPHWWSADKGALLGLILGTIGAITPNVLIKHLIEKGKDQVQWLLTKVFGRLIPLFILGFIVRIHETRLLEQLIATYGILIAWLCLFIFIYILLLFLIGNGGSWTQALKSLRHLLPAGGIAFSSGCSISTMPWTIDGTSKTLKNPDLAKAVIPATTNIQQIGDCIINTFLCFIIYRHFYGDNPTWYLWLHFSMIFVLARFATAAILGGAIFIMLPVYESYLMFNSEMIALILAFNVILDPLVTASNVIANGALCKIYEKVWNFVLQWAGKIFSSLIKEESSKL